MTVEEVLLEALDAIREVHSAEYVEGLVAGREEQQQELEFFTENSPSDQDHLRWKQ